MDNLTHSLVGALIGQAGLKKKTGLAMPALIIGANLPDVDAACFFWLEGVEHLGFRRGITHGPPALLLLPLILAGLLWAFDRWQAGRGKRPEGRMPVDFKWLYLLAFIGCLTHPALDWLNVYGIRLLEPFSSQWFYGDTLFIIDVWLWGLLIVATWLSMRREKRGGNWRRTAQVALSVAGIYIFANGVITGAAERGYQGEARDEIIASPKPLVFWEREMISYRKDPGGWTYPIRSDWSVIGGYSDDRTSLGGPAPQAACNSLPVGSQSEEDAFRLWSRVPFLETCEDGALLLRDGRFYDPMARGRFTVKLAKPNDVEPSGE
ncbi:metal-dependent hydrolase [Erythrobacter sp. HKB08]|uniref:metal-dependent hydrolase n=1 Tax=Erythrobacter sp. HKB08 TaxID=2502843 RepID=UPI001008BD07|nr:metal-dependent hydrolase [Erythrobacter sp. HKB08]